MTNTPEPRIAVAGCGHWGRNLVRNFAALGALAAVHDTDAEIAAAMAAEHGAPACAFEDILADPAIDALVIAAPAVQHYALAREAIEAGKHVFCEKPLALEVAQAEHLVELAAARERVLMVGHRLQYHPAFLCLFDMRAEGRRGRLHCPYSNRLNLGQVGRLRKLRARFCSP